MSSADRLDYRTAGIFRRGAGKTLCEIATVAGAMPLPVAGSKITKIGDLRREGQADHDDAFLRSTLFV